MNCIYRWVFNRALGVWQVASELVKSGGSVGGGAAPNRQRAALSPLGFALMCSLGWVSWVPMVQGQDGHIASDPTAPGRERPIVLAAPNDVPVVNITTPSAAGVSRNHYSQLDVGQEGAILNNARGQVQTQLGGWVQGNPWLANGSARVILNEVNGPASHLNGYMEVAGQRAEVIIANPAGIQINGGGFLNASRVTLTTGTPMFTGGGALEGYRVSGGAIHIGDDGLDTSRVDYTDLITRSLKVNAGIWANQLQATLGSNVVSADHSQVKATAASGPAPELALDVGALGGMFANKIWLVGNEHGVGVRNAGDIGAQAGELVLTADGHLENSGTLQSLQRVQVEAAGGIANSGTVAATGEVAITSGGTLDNSDGTLNAQRLQVQAQGLRNGGGAIEQTGVQALALTVDVASNRDGGQLGALDAVAAGGNNSVSDGGSSPGSGGATPGTNTAAGGNGNVGNAGGSTGTSTPSVVPMAEGRIVIAGTLDNDGGRISNGGGVALTARNGLDNSGGRLGVSALQAGGDLRNDAGTLQVHGDAALQLGALSNQKGALSVAGGLQLEVQSLDNRGGELRQAGQAASSLTVQGLFNNDGGVLASSAAQLALRAGQVGNAGGRIEHAGEGGLQLSTGDWAGLAGRLSTLGRLQWTAGNADLRNASLTAAGFDIVAGTLDNRGGSLLSVGTDASTVMATTLDNSAGGTLAGNGDLHLTATTLNNRQGLVQQAGTGRLQVQAATLHGEQGRLLSNGDLALSGGQLDVSGGTTSAQRVQIQADGLRNAGGQMVAQGTSELALDVRDRLDNTGGTIAGNGALQVRAGELLNRTGTLSGAGTADSTLQVIGTLDNHAGTIASNADRLTLTAGHLDNSAGSIRLAGNQGLDITVGRLDGHKGTVVSAATLTLRADEVDHRDATLGAERLDIEATTLDNAGGRIIASGEGASRIKATSVGNAGGTLASTGDLTLQAQTLDNSAGQIQHAGSGQLQIAAQTLSGTGGRVLSNGQLVLEGDNLDLTGGTTSARRVEITAGALTTAGGTLTATGEEALRLRVQEQLDNRGGTLASNGVLDVSAQQLINAQGTLQGAGTDRSTLAIGQRLDNQGGRMVLGGAGTITAADLDNRGGTVHAGGSELVLGIDGHLDNSAQGLLSSAGAMTLDAGSLDNGHGTVVAGKDLAVTTVAGVDNRDGAMQTGERLQLQATGLDNQRGTLLGGQLDIDTRGQRLDNRAGTLGTQQGALSVRSGVLDNQGGRVQSAADLIIDTAGHDIDNRATAGSGGLLAAGTLQLKGGALDSRGGTVSAQGDAQLQLAGVDNRAGGTLASAADLSLQAATLANSSGRVQAGGNLDLALSGHLDNAAGAIAAGQVMTLTATSVDNRTTGGGDGTLGLQAGQLQLSTQVLDNSQGQIVTDGNARLQVGSQLQNTGGVITAGGNLDSQADSIVNSAGLLRADGSQRLVARTLSEEGQVHAQGDLSLTLQQGMHHRGEWIANGTVSLHLAGDLDNQGIVRGGHLDLNAQNITNAASGELSSQGTTYLNAGGQLTNRGLIDGALTHLEASEVDNVGTGRIYGDHVAISAGVLKNHAQTVGGTDRAGTIAARERLDLGVGTLQNTGTGLIYSGGDAAIGGALDADQQAIGAAHQIDNLSSTLDVAGDLSISTQVLNNIRENVAVTQVKTVDRTVTMNVAAWQKNGSNTGTLSNTSNYKAYEYFYLAPEDILQKEPYIAPDGTVLTKAVIRLTPATSRFYYGVGGLGTSPRAERWRLNSADQTVTVYYAMEYADQSNPDTVAGVSDPAAFVQQQAFHYDNDALSFGQGYGTCGSQCVLIIAPFGYSDPDTTILSRQQHPTEHDLVEEHRIAHHVAIEDQLQPGVGAEAVIRSGGNMALTQDVLNNHYARIVAGGDLAIRDLSGTGTGQVNNLSVTLHRQHTFENTSIAYDGTRTPTPMGGQGMPISEVIGQLSGQITANGTLSIDTGSLSNLNQGSDAPNVQKGVAMSNLNAQGQGAALTGSNHGAQGATQSSGVSAQGMHAGQAEGSSASSGPRAVAAAGNSPDRIVMGAPNTRVPTASLFNVHATGGQYLVETDPRFTDHRTWLGSDYLLRQMGFDPAATQKRLGDGYYEQRLIREQVGQLTGRRFLDGYANDEAQYRALLEAGATVASQWGLRPGVALTEAQMAQLTSDIVWLVEQTITLADGSTTTALVPQVYLRLRAGDLDGQGALLAGANVDISLTKGLVNTGNIAGRKLVTIEAGNIEHLGGSISGQYVGLASDKDIRIAGATVTATDALSVQAAGNVSLASTVQTIRGSQTNSDEINRLDRVAGLYVTAPDGAGVLSVAAGGDIRLQAAQISNAGAQGTTQLVAGGNIEVGALALEQRQQTSFNDRNQQRSSQTTHVVTAIEGAGDVVLAAGKDITLAAAQLKAGGGMALQAGGDIISQALRDSSDSDLRAGGKRSALQVTQHDETVRGSQLSADGGIALSAGRDVTLVAAQVRSDHGAISIGAERDVNVLAEQETHTWEQDSQTKKRGLTSSTRTTTHDATQDVLAVGTTLSAEKVIIGAGRDVTLQAAQVVGTGDVIVAAGRDLTVGTATSTHSEQHDKTVKRSGVFGGGGFNLTVGQNTLDKGLEVEQSTPQGSVIGSTDGRVSLTAGNTLHITGSDVLSKTGTQLVGSQVVIDAAVGTTSVHQSTRQKSAGVNVGLTGGVVDTALTAYGAAKAADNAQDDRLKALYGMQAANAAVATADALQQGTSGASEGVSLRIGIGASSSSASQTSYDQNAVGSTIGSQGDVSIVATGGDLNIIGSQVKGDNVALAARDNINLRSQAEEHTLTSKNKSGSGEIGFSIGAQTGWYVSASTSQGKGSGNGLTHAETTVDAGNTLTIISGKDTTLQGAQLTGEKVLASIGGNLSIISEQDTDDYASKQMQAGGTFVYGSGGSASIGQQKVESHLRSVQEQSGIVAGKGGFDITVGGNTHLEGGVIGSTADASRNRLDTGSLTIVDLQNESRAKTSGGGIGSGFGGGGGMSNPLGSLAGAGLSQLGGVKENDSSTTRSDIAAGTMIVRDGNASALAGLDRIATGFDTGNALSAVDLRTLQEREQVMKLGGQLLFSGAGDLAGYMADKADTPEGKAFWADGGTGRSVLHGMAGAVMAALGGADALQGALGAAGAEKAKQAISDYLESNKGNLSWQDYQALMEVGSAMVGGLLGGSTGADVALTGDRFNRQLHAEQLARIKDMAADDLTAEARLYVAACALKKCSAEFPAGSDEYLYWKSIEDLGNSESLASERDWLSAQSTTDVTATKLGVSESTRLLFSYDWMDTSADWSSWLNNKFQLTTRAGGGFQLVGGAGAVVVGGAGCAATAGLACAIGIPTMYVGGDQAFAGANTLVWGVPTSTAGGYLLTQAGLSPDSAEAVYGLLGAGIVPGIGKGTLSSFGGLIPPRAGVDGQIAGSVAKAVEGGVVSSKTGTIWDSIGSSGAVHPGSVIPRQFELTLSNGQKVWVDGNATKHIAEYAAGKAVYATPEAVRLSSQVQLESLAAAVNTASESGIVYRQMMNSDGWELIFAPPKSAGQFPALYHALYKVK